MRFEQTIDAFASALVDPMRAPPLQTMGREGAPDSRRFAVYRNNIAVSLIAAIEARYPVARRLVGDAFFRAMARAFVARSKPRSAVILHYGADFPDFIAEFEPARDIAYLADVARLENAWVDAYHSAEAEPLALDGARRRRSCDARRFAAGVSSRREVAALRSSRRLDLGGTPRRRRGQAAGALARRGDARHAAATPRCWCAFSLSAAILSPVCCRAARRSARLTRQRRILKVSIPAAI